MRLPHWNLGDWDIMVEAGRKIVAGEDPYFAPVGISDGTWRYSPLLAYAFAVVEPIGKVGWLIVPFAMLALLRDWRLIAVFLVSAPFWWDVESGLSFIEIPLAALVALRGSRSAALALVAMAVLMPRPMMLPLVGWFLWQRPYLRLPGAIIALALTAGAFLTGWGDEWIKAMLSVASASSESGQIRLTTLLGPFWLVMPALAAWLTWRGQIGLAALAISPYWTPTYPMLLVLDLPLRVAAADASHEDDLAASRRSIERRRGWQRVSRLLKPASSRTHVR
ncbi:MAG TPA: hypothetical protein VF190_01425 [Rhodothermales bacterium]